MGEEQAGRAGVAEQRLGGGAPGCSSKAFGSESRGLPPPAQAFCSQSVAMQNQLPCFAYLCIPDKEAFLSSPEWGGGEGAFQAGSLL